MRFWFELGVDGFRIDVAHGLAKADGLPDVGSTAWPPPAARSSTIPTGTATRSTTSTARGARWPTPTRTRACSWPKRGCTTPSGWRSTSAPTSCTPRSTSTSCWRRGTPSRCATRSSPPLAAHEAVGAPPTWVLSNHDTVREVSRYARPQGGGRCASSATSPACPPTSPSGRRRARAAALLMLALPGGAYVYQGEELGLRRGRGPPRGRVTGPRVGAVRPDRARPRRLPGADPVVGRGAAVRLQPGRCERPAVATAAGRGGGELTVEAQTGDEGSMLELYRRALQPSPRPAGAWRRGALRGLTRPTGAWRSRATPDSCASSTCPAIRWPSQTGRSS